jgi:hypothetical protein
LSSQSKISEFELDVRLTLNNDLALIDLPF